MKPSAVQPEAAPARYYGGATAEALDVSAEWGIGELVIHRTAGGAIDGATGGSIVARWRLEDLVMRRDTRGGPGPAVSVRGSGARLVVVSPALRAELGRVPYLSVLVAPPPLRHWWRWWRWWR